MPGRLSGEGFRSRHKPIFPANCKRKRDGQPFRILCARSLQLLAIGSKDNELNSRCTCLNQYFGVSAFGRVQRKGDRTRCWHVEELRGAWNQICLYFPFFNLSGSGRRQEKNQNTQLRKIGSLALKKAAPDREDPIHYDPRVVILLVAFRRHNQVCHTRPDLPVF